MSFTPGVVPQSLTESLSQEPEVAPTAIPATEMCLSGSDSTAEKA
ncbi:MAG: hypothetical protein A07HR60_02609 [uncultured archaeon A07HR60]|nr:MAG: hypothetical protein A07HR60_02609 [uncultured archaeon A07HR60]